MALMAKMIDVTRCTGCRACQVACKQWNQLPAQIEAFKGSLQTHAECLYNTWTFVKFIEQKTNGKTEWLFRKHQCMHCQDAACISVCPVGAFTRSDVGSVIRNYSVCKGCGDCADKCPFKATKINPTQEKDYTYNCRFCWDRVGNGLTPACAKACTTGAIQFGDRTAMISAANARVNEIKNQFPAANVYGVNEMRGTLVIYVLAYAPATYGLTANQQNPQTGEYDWQGYWSGNPCLDPNHYRS